MPKRKVKKVEENESSENEWEDVEEKLPYESDHKDVEVELDLPEVMKNRQSTKQAKMKDWLMMFINRAINKSKKDIQVYMHKTHLLCLLSIGIQLNNVSKDLELEGLVLSILPVHYATIFSFKFSQEKLLNLVTWINGAFDIKNLDEKADKLPVRTRRSRLKNAISNFVITSQVDYVLVCLLVFRSLGLHARLVLSLQPMPLKPLTAKQKERQSSKVQVPLKQAKTKQRTSINCNNKIKLVKEEENIPQLDGASDVIIPGQRVTRSKANALKTSNQIVTTNTRIKQKSAKVVKTEDINKVKSLSQKDKSEKEHQTTKTSDTADFSKYHFTSVVDFDSADTNLPAAKKISRLVKSKQSVKPKSSSSKNDNSDDKKLNFSTDDEHNMSDSSDDDFIISRKRTKKSNSQQSRSTTLMKRQSKVQTTSSSNAKLNQPVDHWIEVYLEKVGWVCVEGISGVVNQPSIIEQNTTKPLRYVLAFNNENSVKDVTARYASNWLTTTRKLRVGSVDKNWWKDTLRSFATKNQILDEEENKELEAHLLSQPLPSTINAYKDHPLFALRRHLLKYEAIYPPDIPAIGLVRGEEVLPRSAVHVLHTREKWLQVALSVKDGEEPYKMVSSWILNKKLNRDSDALSQALFGKWQTEPYQPPVAENGKVPRNAFGNVDLFQPSMLPIGCVQMRLPNLATIARKLDIDIASTIVGFDTHHGFPHPVTDGYIVCKEYEDVLRNAWEEEQDHICEMEKQKMEKRVYSRWKTFIRGMLALNRVRQKYSTKADAAQDAVSSNKKRDTSEPWQAKRLREMKERTNKRTRRSCTKNQESSFPFEVETL